MTETTRTVLDKYQVRKNKKQKAAFREYVKQIAEENEWSYSEEKGSLGAVNIVVGDPNRARVIYTAHYDTCARLPFPNFITPKSLGIYLLYQLAVVVAMLAVIAILEIPLFMLRSYVLSQVVLWMPVSFILYLFTMIPFFLVIFLMLAGPANKHTANDNTSGVTVLLDLMTSLTPKQREKTAIVFFDLEEAGLFGSMGFASKHKNITRNTLLINFDCVSDGDTILFALKKGSRHTELIKKSFVSNEDVTVDITAGGAFYPSDQANFRHGIGVAALKKTRRGILYMDRIHTNKDVIYREENISFLCDGAKKLIDNIDA